MAEAPVAGLTPEDLEVGDMQALVGRAYGHLPFAYYALCRVGDAPAARAWLGGVADQLVTADREKDDNPATNLAVTYEGLAALGLAADALATFPRPMKEGMVTDHRSRILGDFGASDPTRWRWGGPASGQEVHLLVIVYAKTAEALTVAYAARQAEWEASGALVEVTQPILGCLMDGTEHFGFADGISQPNIKGWPTRSGSVQPPAPPTPAKYADVEPGEILLGYADNYRRPAVGPSVAEGGPAQAFRSAPWAPKRRDLGRNGSYLVFRQLAQDVPGFQRFTEAASQTTTACGRPLSPAAVGAEMVGRWASGASLVLYPDADPGQVGENDFGYQETDGHGLGCPVGAHVRRSNPRDGGDDPKATLASTMTHRILRRGRPFGQKLMADSAEPGHQPDAERGLLFICLNADIERQFEFVQHTWLNNRTFGGLYNEIDPVVGTQPAGGGQFTIPSTPVRQRLTGVPEFVVTLGGAYFFLPGIKAVRYLAAMGG